MLQNDWQKEKRDFLQSLSRLSTFPLVNKNDKTAGAIRPGHIASLSSSSTPYAGPLNMDIVPSANKPIQWEKATLVAQENVLCHSKLQQVSSLPMKVWVLRILEGNQLPCKRYGAFFRQ